MVRQEYLSGPNTATPKLHLRSGIGTSLRRAASRYYTLHVSSINSTVIDTRCQEETQAAGGGCKFKRAFKNASNLIASNSYNIISDMAQRKYVNQAAPTELWPHLLYLYHTHREPRALHMVRGEFR